MLVRLRTREGATAWRWLLFESQILGSQEGTYLWGVPTEKCALAIAVLGEAQSSEGDKEPVYTCKTMGLTVEDDCTTLARCFPF